MSTGRPHEHVPPFVPAVQDRICRQPPRASSRAGHPEFQRHERADHDDLTNEVQPVQQVKRCAEANQKCGRRQTSIAVTRAPAPSTRNSVRGLRASRSTRAGVIGEREPVACGGQPPGEFHALVQHARQAPSHDENAGHSTGGPRRRGRPSMAASTRMLLAPRPPCSTTWCWPAGLATLFA